MKKDRAKDAAPAPAKAEPFNNPFAKLAGTVPAASAASPASPAEPGAAKPEAAKPEAAKAAAPKPAAKPAPKPNVPARAVIRYERKGRGGKEVTVVEKLGLPPKALAEWLKALKQSLGVGGQLEGDALVLQGDQRERLKAILTQKGIGQISVG